MSFASPGVCACGAERSSRCMPAGGAYRPLSCSSCRLALVIGCLLRRWPAGVARSRTTTVVIKAAKPPPIRRGPLRIIRLHRNQSDNHHPSPLLNTRAGGEFSWLEAFRCRQSDISSELRFNVHRSAGWRRAQRSWHHRRRARIRGALVDSAPCLALRAAHRLRGATAPRSSSPNHPALRGLAAGACSDGPQLHILPGS